jgi:phosphoribosyl-AMP cyclohydrolase
MERKRGENMNIIEQLKFDSDGLIPAIAQEEKSGEILMMAWMNRESLRATIETNRATYWSRSRKKIWIKGEESGNFQEVRSIHVDCDGDVVLLKVNQVGGAACHTGHRTCFYREITDEGQNFKESNDIVFDPKTVYRK